MPATSQFLVCWSLAFLSLGVALGLLNLFSILVGNDLELLKPRSEAVIAIIASLIEGTSLWLVITFVPAAIRALIFPVLIVAFIYKVAHLESWGRFDILMLFVFQLFAGSLIASLFFGHFQTALYILVGFGLALAVLIGLARNFLD